MWRGWARINIFLCASLIPDCIIAIGRFYCWLVALSSSLGLLLLLLLLLLGCWNVGGERHYFSLLCVIVLSHIEFELASTITLRR